MTLGVPGRGMNAGLVGPVGATAGRPPLDGAGTVLGAAIDAPANDGRASAALCAAMAPETCGIGAVGTISLAAAAASRSACIISPADAYRPCASRASARVRTCSSSTGTDGATARTGRGGSV